MNVGGPDGSYFWSAGTFTIIPGRDTHMEDMNKFGQVVGAQDGGYPERKAIVWDIASPGSVQILAIPGVGPNAASVAEGIADDGAIVGIYWAPQFNSQPRYFLATPVPEPGSTVLLAAGSLGLVGHRRRLNK